MKMWHTLNLWVLVQRLAAAVSHETADCVQHDCDESLVGHLVPAKVEKAFDPQLLWVTPFQQCIVQHFEAVNIRGQVELELFFRVVRQVVECQGLLLPEK